MKVTFLNIDDPSDRIEFHVPAQALDPQELGAGKAQSYAKKYALLQTFLLPTHLDPEQDAGKVRVQKPTGVSEDGQRNGNGKIAAPSPEAALLKFVNCESIKTRIYEKGVLFKGTEAFLEEARTFALLECQRKSIDWDYVNRIKKDDNAFVERFVRYCREN